MDCLSATGLLILQIVCMHTQTAVEISDEKQQLADTLDSLLKFPAWSRINDRAKYQNAAGEIESFSGRDLYAFDLNEEYDASVYRKYEMIVHLLGCVYTKAMLKFLNLLNVILLECRRARIRGRSNADNRVTRDCENHGIRLTSEERAVALRVAANFAKYKTVFDIALRQLESRYSMLDSMSTALRYLVGLAPMEKMHKQLMQDVQIISVDIDEIKNLPAYIGFVIQNDSGSVGDNEKYKKKMKILSDKVTKTINIKNAAPLVKFKHDRCILPDDEQIEQLLKTEYRGDDIIEEMKKHENEVLTRFYEHLGFVYVDQATILATDIIQNANNSDLLPNDTIP